MVSAFAATAFAADCKVNDSDISGEYVGGCENGLAHGKGKAKGRDTYEGEFKLGNKQGKGSYRWGTGEKYIGDYLNDQRHGKGVQTYADGVTYDGDWSDGKYNGFGKVTLPTSASNGIKYFGNTAKLVGGVYVAMGMFKNQHLYLSCTSPQNCKQEQANREAQERREAAERESRERDRVANACNNFYQGKSIGFKPAGFSYFGSVLDAVVLGKGNGNVSIKIVDRHFTDLYGKTLEMSCTSDQLQ